MRGRDKGMVKGRGSDGGLNVIEIYENRTLYQGSSGGEKCLGATFQASFIINSVFRKN